jgi:SAM-dependent methyltransferase
MRGFADCQKMFYNIRTFSMDTTFWDDRYAAEEYAYGESPNAFVAEMAMYIPDGPVLCLAEGEGRNAVYIAKSGHRVTAVDQSAMGLNKALRLAEANGAVIETIHADLEDYQIMPGAWAGIVATFAHLPPSLRRKVHAAVVQGLKPDGVFILEAYTPAQLALGTGGPKVPELLMTLDSLRDELAGLEFIVTREIERDVTEGTFHQGRGAVVQILARRPQLPP